jgi:uncharacterized SAM-binding protein YcdF (DUF218 family)
MFGWVLAVVLLFAIGIMVWLALVAFRVWWVARDDDRARTDAIVVLGASQYDGTPSPVLEARLEHALTLYQDGVAPTIITVGGKRPADRFTEAASGKAWLVDKGVKGSDVVAVGEGRDTWTSLVAVDQEMEAQGWTSAVIVTDPWHSFRSREMARHLGIEATTSPTRTGPVVQERFTEVRYVIRETGAYAAFQWQRLTGTLPDGG